MWIVDLGWTFPLRATFFLADAYQSWPLALKAFQETKICPPRTSKLLFHNIWWTWHAGNIHVWHENHQKDIWLYQNTTASNLQMSSYRVLFIPYSQNNLGPLCFSVHISTANWSHDSTSLWLSSSDTMARPWLSENQQTVKKILISYHLYLTVSQHASLKQCVFSLEKAVIPVSQCKGEKLAPLWPLAVELGPASGEVGDTGTSKAGLGICKAACLLFFDRLLAWRGGEVSPWELAVWRTPQLVESSGEGSKFTAGLLSGQVWAVWGFPWGHEAERSGERVADSSRPLVPCVHWGGTGERRGGKDQN